MKKILLILSFLIPVMVYCQINPTNGTVSNKSYSPAQAVPTDFRSQYYDAANFIMRDYQNTSEVLFYLNLSKYRSGHFPIYVHNGGTLNPNGTYTGGTTDVYCFLNGVADGDLVQIQSSKITGSQGIIVSSNDIQLGGTITSSRLLELSTSAQFKIRNSGVSGGILLSVNSLSSGDSTYISMNGLNPSPSFSIVGMKSSGNNALFQVNSATFSVPNFLFTVQKAAGLSDTNTVYSIKYDSVIFNNSIGSYFFRNLSSSSDSTSIKPAGFDANGRLVRLSYWPGSGGGGGGGSGTVTSFSSGNLSPLFTTSVSTATTTPSLSFTLSNSSAYTLFGRGSGTGVPSFLASIDSNWIPTLHSENYYNTKYLGINAGITGTISSGQVVYATGSSTVGSEAAFAYNSSTDLLTVNKVQFGATSTTNAPFNVGSFGTLPTSPSNGDVAFQSSDTSIRIRVGTNWIPFNFSKSLVAGSNITFSPGSAWNVPDTISATGGGGGGSPAGSNTYIQYNNSGSFGANARLAYNSGTQIFTSPGMNIQQTGYILAKMKNAQADTATTSPYGHFYFTLDSSFVNPGGQKDQVMFWAYNSYGSGSGGRFNTNEAAIHYGIESEYFGNFETYIGFTNKAGTMSYRAMGMDINKTTGINAAYFRMNTLQIFPDTSSRSYMTLTNTKLSYDLFTNSSYFEVQKSTTSDYFQIGVDTSAASNRWNITTTRKVHFTNSVNVNGTFTTASPVGGTSVEFGNMTLKSGSDVQLKFAPSNAITYNQGFKANADYGGFGINGPNVFGRTATSNEGFEMLWDARNVTAPLRFGFINTSGTETFHSYGADGRLSIGQNVQNPAVSLYINFSDAIRIPSGNTGARPTPATAYVRWNTDSTRIEVYNGSAWRGLLYNGEGGSGGSGITSLNSQTGATQTFATPGTSGTAPNWSSSSNIHTINIPLMNNSGVTAGLLSNGAQDIPGVKNFISKPTGGGTVTGNSFEVGSFGMSSSGAVTMKFGPSNATTYGIGMNANADYFQFGGNSPNLFGRVTSTEGAALFFDFRGITAPFRLETTTTGGTSTYTSVLANGSWSIGSSTTTANSWMDIAAGTTSRSQLYFASSVDPSSPVDGQFWNNSGTLKFRTGGASVNILTSGSVLGVGNGGTNITSYTTGDLIYASGSGTLSKLGIGSNGYILGSNGSTPVWIDPATLGNLSATLNTSSTSAQTVATLSTSSNERGVIEVTMVGLQSSGTSGTTGKKIVEYKNVSGSMTVGTIQNTLPTVSDDGSTWTITTSGTNIIIQVTPGSSTSTTWYARYNYTRIVVAP